MKLDFRKLLHRLASKHAARFEPMPISQSATRLKTKGATNAVRLELLSGARHSIQSMTDAVEGRGYVLNHVNSRINEVKKQLNNRGVEVCVERDGAYQVWYVKPSEVTRKLAAEMKGCA